MSLIYGYNEKEATGSKQVLAEVEANKESIEDIKEFIGDAGSVLREILVLRVFNYHNASAFMQLTQIIF